MAMPAWPPLVWANLGERADPERSLVTVSFPRHRDPFWHDSMGCPNNLLPFRLLGYTCRIEWERVAQSHSDQNRAQARRRRPPVYLAHPSKVERAYSPSGLG